jgi:uncharacterized protein (UPF0548 family)
MNTVPGSLTSVRPPLPRFGLSKPREAEIERLLALNAPVALSYEDHGATWREMPPGWDVGEREVALGQGQAVWERARAALASWTQFDLTWVEPFRRDVPITPGAQFAFSSWQLGVWTVCVSRVVEVVDDAVGDVSRYGFCYGTVGSHVLRGEERFLVSRDHRTDAVTFSIRRFSKPSNAFLTLAKPIVTRFQDRFLREAVERFRAEVAS